MRCYYHIESSVCLVSFCPISHVSVSFCFSVWAFWCKEPCVVWWQACVCPDAFVTLLVWCTNGAVRADLLMYVMMHQQSLWCYLAVSIWILVQFLSSGSLFHSHQGSLTHRQKSQRLAAEPAIMMFNDIPSIAVGLEITHSLNSSIHSFIHSLFFLQHRFRHKVTAILRTNIYTLDYYWNIVFDYWNIDLIKYCHVWCAFSCLFINGEKYDQVKKDRKTKGWVHHNFCNI